MQDEVPAAGRRRRGAHDRESTRARCDREQNDQRCGIDVRKRGVVRIVQALTGDASPRLTFRATLSVVLAILAAVDQEDDGMQGGGIGMSVERTLTFVGGGSAKFWAVRQDGAELHIRYGRLGTAGQTQIKSFGSAAVATAAADKLVAEKLRKGYTEDETTSSPRAASPAAADSVEDEDRLTLPPAWLRAPPSAGRSEGLRAAAGRRRAREAGRRAGQTPEGARRHGGEVPGS
ncbi:WGR domain-containing protein [Nonomuraea wenchangensis]|uniref:WGR domain-containing protein n=1 Tax=Nonomuraea wenchangensis TaxID=568860 RepID=UPI00341BB519